MKWSIKHKSGRVLFVTSDEFIADNRRKMGWIVEEVKMTSREQFEEWWEVNYHNGNPPRFGWEYWRDGDGYKIDDDESELDCMWEAWQASRAAIEIELPEPCSPGDFCVDIPAQAHNEVIEAIESAGLKVKK